MCQRRLLKQGRIFLATVLVGILMISVLIVYCSQARLMLYWLSLTISGYPQLNTLLTVFGGVQGLGESYEVQPWLSEMRDVQTRIKSQGSGLADESRSSEPECDDLHQNSYDVIPYEYIRPSVPSFDTLFIPIEVQKNISENQPKDFFTKRPEVVQRLVTDYIIVPHLTCPYLLVLQLSVISRQNERDVVRQTWASVNNRQKWPHRSINADVAVVFIVGRQGEPSSNLSDDSNEIREDEVRNYWHEVETSITIEDSRHRDILYLNMIDSYNNLTLKLVSAFKWVKDNCPCVKFVLKVDYDTFVNVPLLVDTLLYYENRLEMSILGRAYTMSSYVKTRGKWKIDTNVYPMPIFPVYASGCGYVLSRDVLYKMVDAAPYVPMFSIEDAYITGVLRNVIECQMFALQTLFAHFLEEIWDMCAMFHDKKILMTRGNQTRHMDMWRTFRHNGSTCSS